MELEEAVDLQHKLIRIERSLFSSALVTFDPEESVSRMEAAGIINAARLSAFREYAATHRQGRQEP